MGWWSSVDWGSVAGAAASLYASNQAGKAAKDAGNAAAAGSEAAVGLQRDIYQDQRALNMPFYNSQLAAMNEWNTLMGLPGVQGGTTGGGAFGGGTTNAMPTQWLAGGKVPTVNSQLYASDPTYRKAWDQAVSEHQRQFGKGYTKDSSANAVTQRLQQLYNQFKPQATTPTGGNSQNPALTPAQAQQAAFAKFRAQPGYQFGLDEGNKQVQSSAAAHGGLLSGKTLKALTKFGTDYADQQGFSPYMNRLASAAGIGQTNPVGSLTNAAGQYGQSAGGFMQNAANARASGMMNAANARQQGWADAAGFLGQWYGGRG